MKRETYLKGLLAFLLLMVGANPSWADDPEPTWSSNGLTATITASQDGWYRVDNSNVTYNIASDANKHIEVKRYDSGDFYGLLSFQVPTKAGYKVASVSLRLVTKKRGRNVSTAIYKLNSDLSTSPNYETLSAANGPIETALNNTALGTFTPSGISSQISSDNITNDSYKTIDAWQNNIALDATSITYGKLNLLIAIPTSESSNTNANRFFGKNAPNFTNTNISLTCTSDELVPKLTITYEAVNVLNQTTNTGYETLSAALSAASAGDVIWVNTDQELGATTISNAITLKAGVNGVKISRATSVANNATWLFITAAGIVIGDATNQLIFDGGSVTNATRDMIRFTGTGADILTNVKFQNYTSSYYSMLRGNANGTLTLNKVVFDNVACTDATSGIIRNEKSSGIIFNGTDAITFTECSGNELVMKEDCRFVVNNGTTFPSNMKVYCSSTKLKQLVLIFNSSSDASTYLPMFSIANGDLALVNTKASGTWEYSTTEAKTVTIGAGGYATFVTPFAATVPAGVTVYDVTYSSGSAVTTAASSQVSAGVLAADKPVLLQAAAGDYKFVNPNSVTTATTGSGTPTNGALTGVYAETAAPAGSYILSGNIFQKSNGENVAANQAYVTATGATTSFLTIGTAYSKPFIILDKGNYDTLEGEGGALAAVSDGGTIYIQSDITISNQVSFTKNVNIVPAANVTITNNVTDKPLFSLAAEVGVTMGNGTNTITIDGNNTETTVQLAEVKGDETNKKTGTLTFVNTTIKDVATSNAQGVLCAKSYGYIVLNGVTFNGCQATATNAGVVFSGRDDGIKLQGTNTFTNCTGYNFCVEKRLRVPAAITAPASPYTVYIKPKDDGSLNIAVGSPVVCYTTPSHFATSHFEVKNAGYQVATSLSGNDLKLEKTDYTINLPTDGTVTINLADATKAHIGDEVTVTVTVPATKQLEALTYTPEGETAIDIKAAKAFSMPAKNVTINVTYVDFVSYDHPIMLHKQADIDRVKGNIGYAPIKDAWAHLQASNFAQASYTAHPVEYLKRMDAQWSSTYPDYNNYTYAMRDANAAYQLALRYQLSGDETYAAKAAAILDAWATTNQGILKITGGSYTNDIPDPNEYLICIQGHQFANAAELLNGYTWSGKDAFVTWMGSTFYDLAHTFLTTHHETSNPNLYPRHYWLNWDLAAMTAVLSYGILANDQAKVAEALNYYTTSSDFNGYMGKAIGTANTVDGKVIAQSQESGRDQGHTMLDVALLGAFCQMATNVSGEDYFVKAADGNGNALQMAEYVAKYNLQKDDLFPNAVLSGDATDPTDANYQYADNDTNFPFVAMNYSYSSTETINHTKNSPKARGSVRPVWELFYRYAKQNSKDCTYTEKWVNQMRKLNTWGEGGAGDYGTESTGFDQLGYGTLMYAEPSSTNGQDTDDLSAYSTYNKAEKSVQGDTYVRSDDGSSKNGSAKQIEVYNGTKSFYGMLSFTLPNAAIGHVKKAQLRLTTKRYKTGRNINVYAYSSFDEANANYTSESSNITTAKGKAQLATFKPMGDNDKDVTTDEVTTTTKDGWTNKIDLTGYVQSLTTKEVNLLLTDAGSGDNNNAVQFFSKEWTDAVAKISVTDGSILQPQLIVYHDGTSTGAFSVGEDSFATLDEALEEVQDGGTITVTGNATVSARITFTKSVTIKGKTGNEVLTRGSSSTAMKQSVLFKANSGKTVTFDGFIFDDNNATVGQLFEVDNNTFVLKNMTIKNSKSTSANGVISMKKGTLTIDNITFTDCAISNAYLRAAAGTLTLSNGYTLSSSTGKHFRLGNVALDATTLPAGITYKIEVEDAAATITNVSDASKFELTSDGYLKSYNSTTKVISFTEEGDGQDTAINEASYSGKTISKRGATGDTYVRSDNMTRKNGSADQMEIRTNADGSNDFVGLISFKLPAAAIGNVTKAQLRLVTKQKKTNNRIRLYAVGEFDEKEATYETMSSAIAAARGISLLAKFKPKGEYNMDVTKDAGTMSDDSKNLSAWTNYIDLTSYLNSLTTADVNLMLTESEGDGKAIQFFTKERTDAMETSVEGNAFNAASADLVPQLIVVFAEDTSNRKAFYISGEGSYDTLAEAVEAAQDGDEIIVTKNASVSARVTFTKNVTLKAESGVVLSRSAEEAAMKQSVLFKANSGKTVTFDGIVFDDNNATVGQLFEVDNNTFVLKNMTIKNSKSTSANGVISMKKGTLTVEGITFTDCAISNAYLRAAAGTLNFSGNYNLTNSTGNHFRLGSVALNGGTLPAIQGTWRIEVESDGASITNVTDASKFTLASVGYTMSYANNTITFTAEGDGQDTSEIVVPEGYNKSLIDPIIDTYVRKGNASNNGQRMNMEVYTYQSEEEDLDFAGLMAFKLPDDLTKSGAKLEKAQLRLVTKRVKGSRIIDMYQIYTDFDEEAIYDQMEKRLTDAREGGYMRRFQAKGQAGMDIEADSLKLTDEYKDIKNWTNLIDLTDVVQNVMFDDGILRFALSAPVNGKDPKQFYTSEAETFKNAVMQVSYADLIPQLILVYSPGNGASTLTAQTQEAYPNIDLFLRKGSTSDNSSSEVMEVYTFNDGNQDQDFIGLMSFNLDNEVASARSVVRARSNSDLELFNATLRLVTKRLKGEREMNVFLFDTPFGANSTYSQLESAINEARTNGDYVTFKSAGMVDKDVVTDDGLTGDYSKTITAWTNYIDVTNLVKKSDRSTFNLMLSAPDNARTPKHYFSGDAESFTNTNYSNFIVSSDELVPLLTITYRNPLYTDIEETIVVPVKKEHIIYDLRGNRVQNAGKGIYIIDGKKVLKK